MGYNPASDPNCQGWWRLEDGVIGTDYSGKGNTLTNDGVAASSTHKEGSYSGDFEVSETDSLLRTDANLSTDFPLKNGDTTKDITTCFWFQIESYAVAAYLVSKYNSALTRACFGVLISNYPKIGHIIGYNSGASYEVNWSADGLSTGRWYHVAATYKGSTKAWKLRVWDDTASSLVFNLSGTKTNEISVMAASWMIGARDEGAAAHFDGLIDDVVVFNRVLTNDECDSIRTQTFNIPVDISGSVTGTCSTQAELSEVSGGVEEVDGFVKGSFSSEGLVSEKQSVEGSVSGSSTFVGSVEEIVSVVGGISGEMTASAVLDAVISISGSIDCTSSLIGSIVQDISVSGSADCTSSLIGATSQVLSVSGSIVSTSFFDATVKSQESISGSSVFSLSADSVLSETVSVSGSIQEESVLIGGVSTEAIIDISGSVVWFSNQNASIEETLIFSGNCSSAMTIEAAVSEIVYVSGQILASTSLLGVIEEQGSTSVGGSVSCSLQATATGSLIVSVSGAVIQVMTGTASGLLSVGVDGSSIWSFSQEAEATTESNLYTDLSGSVSFVALMQGDFSPIVGIGGYCSFVLSSVGLVSCGMVELIKLVSKLSGTVSKKSVIDTTVQVNKRSVLAGTVTRKSVIGALSNE